MAKEEDKNKDAPEIVDIPDDPTPQPPKELFPFKIEDYIAILNQIRTTKRHIEVAPTATPKTFMDQIQFFDDGVDYRLYIYINGTWRYVALT